MLHTLRNSLRLFSISLTLARHDALFSLEEIKLAPALTLISKLVARRHKGLRKGQRLASALEELGPTFIKLGQALSTRSDLIGESVALDLADLRDNLPAFPFKEVKSIIEEEFGAPIESLFSHFEEKPVAAASIAQVHFAVTKAGEEVAVKVLRPGIDEAFERDIELFFWLAGLVERALPASRRLKPIQVVELFAESVKFELDLRFEAGAAVEMQGNLNPEEGFAVPAIDWNRTSQRVMTMMRIKGTPISDIEALKAAGHDLNKILEHLSRAFFTQVFGNGFFHADLHPGNLFVLADGTIAAVDFGIMGRLSRENRIYVAEILYGFLQGDYKHVAEVHFDAGWVPAHKSVENFTLACMAIGKPIMGKPLSDISVGKLLGQLFKITDTFEMETQIDLLMLQKTMVLVEGVGRMLNPQVNMWQMAEPLIASWVHKNLGPEAKLKQVAGDAATFARKLPAMLNSAERVLKMLSEGGIRLHPDSVESMNKSRKRLHRQWLAFAWTALIAVSALLLLRY